MGQMRLRRGQFAPDFAARDIFGRAVSVSEYRGSNVLVTFNRAAVCPLCNVRTYHLMRRYPIYQRFGLEIIAFFESSPERAHFYLDRLQPPYPIIADLQHRVYDLYGLEASFLGGLRALLGRRSVYREADKLRLGSGSNLLENLSRMDGTAARMPGDFLIGPDGRVKLAYYGHDAGDFLLFRDLETAAFGAPMDEQLINTAQRSTFWGQ